MTATLRTACVLLAALVLTASSACTPNRAGLPPAVRAMPTGKMKIVRVTPAQITTLSELSPGNASKSDVINVFGSGGIETKLATAVDIREAARNVYGTGASKMLDDMADTLEEMEKRKSARSVDAKLIYYTGPTTFGSEVRFLTVWLSGERYLG